MPLRPFDNSKFDSNSLIIKYKSINPVVMIPVNWGSFEHEDESIIEPLKDLDKLFPVELKTHRIQIPVIGKTVPII